MAARNIVTSSSVSPGVLRNVSNSTSFLGDHADFFFAFSPRSLEQRLARFDAPGYELDEIATAVGEMRSQSKLTDQHNFLAGQVDRHHDGDFTGDQYIALLHKRDVAVL